MSKVKFTAGRVDRFQCEPGKGQSFLWDADSPGLGLRATANGAKSYIFQSKLNGKAIRLTIGTPKSWAIDAAQAEARRLKVLIDGGQDPRQVHAEQLASTEAKASSAKRQALRESVTLEDAWTEYLKDRKSKWSAKHHSDHEQIAQLGGNAKKRGKGLTEPGALAALLPLPLAELTGDKLAEWLDSESESRPASAALAFRLLRAFATWTADHSDYRGLIPEGAFQTRAVRDALPKGETKEGDSLQREQLPAWFTAVQSIHNPVNRAYLQCLLLTGARRRELTGLRWDDVDFQWNSLTIRDKVEGTRIIPLTPYVASLMQSLPRRNDWVFSSNRAKGGAITDPRHAHATALTVAGLPHVSIHGLRRSFGTLCEWVEMPSGISAQIMGHKPSALAEKHYRRRPLDLLRNWHNKIEVWILEQAKVDFVQAAPGLRVVKQ